MLKVHLQTTYRLRSDAKVNKKDWIIKMPAFIVGAIFCCTYIGIFFGNREQTKVFMVFEY